MDRIKMLKEILPYVRTFQGKTFVLKIGGEVCNSANLDEIAEQISLIHHIGIKVVVVHGGGQQMDEMLDKLGIEKKMIAGRRITDDETLKTAKMVYAGQISTDVVSALRKHGVSAAGLSGADAHIITAVKRPVKEIDEDGKKVKVDFQNVGDIEIVNPHAIEVMLAHSIVPVIASLGADDKGNCYNINADTVASKIVQVMHANKLIIMSNVAGVLKDINNNSTLVSYADVDELNAMIKKGEIKGGMLPKVEACMEAVKHGVHRTHIINGTQAGSLLQELFVNEGCGTMIVDKKEKIEYETHEIK